MKRLEAILFKMKMRKRGGSEIDVWVLLVIWSSCCGHPHHHCLSVVRVEVTVQSISPFHLSFSLSFLCSCLVRRVSFKCGACEHPLNWLKLFLQSSYPNSLVECLGSICLLSHISYYHFSYSDIFITQEPCIMRLSPWGPYQNVTWNLF